MKESAILSFLQLLALIANVTDGRISRRAREIVRLNVLRSARPDKLDQFMAEFQRMLREAHKVEIDKDRGSSARKKRASQSVKALVICERNNEILLQHEKIRIIARLIEFANEDEELNEKELDFLYTVRDAFHIDPHEFEDMKHLIISPWTEGIRPERLICIAGSGNGSAGRSESPESTPNSVLEEGSKFLNWDNLEGEIAALHIASSNIYFVKYSGGDFIFKNSLPLQEGSFEVLDNDSVIRGRKISPIYFNTLNSRLVRDAILKNLDFTVKGVEYKFPNSENGVQEFSVNVGAGDLVGIMGGSGVGKSTLLNVLNGNLQPQKGKVFVNGYDLYRDAARLEGMMGFIPQDDLLMDDLTVFQNLYYNAKLCFSELSKMALLKRVLRVLREMGLFEIKDLKVGSPREKIISGGQRKRLNIGLELMREPHVLFVDEPTSGLSSMDAESVMMLLKKQASLGKIIFVNIHQPSSNIYKLFNRLLVMDRGGYIIYQGDPLDAQVYFKTENDLIDKDISQCETCGNVNAEQVLEIVETKLVNEQGRLTSERRYKPEHWYSSYKEKIESGMDLLAGKMPLPEVNFNIPGGWKQFQIYFSRDIRAKLVNKQYVLITLLEAPLLAVIIAYFSKYYAGTVADPHVYVFSENANLVSYLFMSVVVALFLGMIVSAEEIIKDALILKRESFLNLSRFSYINSKIVVVLIISAIQMLSFVLIANGMLEIKGMGFKYWLMLFSAAAAANLIGLNISSALKTVASIYIVIPLLLVPQILFSGTVVSFDKLRTLRKHNEAVPLIGDLMISRWTFESLAVEQFMNNRFQKNFFYYDQRMSRALYKTSFLLPKLGGLVDESALLSAKLARLSSVDSVEAEKEIVYKMGMFRNELLKLKDETFLELEDMINIIPADRIDAEAAGLLHSYLDTLDMVFSARYQAASRERDEFVERLDVNIVGAHGLGKLRQDYHNESLADLVLNRNQLKKIREYDGQLIQRMDPVYDYPSASNGRAQMYSAVKRLGNYDIDTYWFNLSFIWMMSVLAYLILYYDLLRKGMDLLESRLNGKGN